MGIIFAPLFEIGLIDLSKSGGPNGSDSPVFFDLASSGLGVVSHMTKFFMNHPWQDYVKILISQR